MPSVVAQCLSSLRINLSSFSRRLAGRTTGKGLIITYYTEGRIATSLERMDPIALVGACEMPKACGGQAEGAWKHAFGPEQKFPELYVRHLYMP